MIGGILITAATVTVVAMLPALRRAKRFKPKELNVLLITLDTTRADALGCYGNTVAHTPNLDRLAMEGTRFDGCTTCASITLPSHCSIMTGLYPFVHGVRRNGVSRLADEHETLAEHLKTQALHTRAIIASFVLNRVFGIDQGFDQYSEVPRGTGLIALHAERRGDEVANQAIGALRALASERFFLWVHFYDAHFPYRSSHGQAEDSPGAYAEEVSFTDAQVGRVVDELASLGIERRTLIVVVGDHGEAFGEHGESQHGYFVYDTTLRVPLILRCPGVVPQQRVVRSNVRTIDIAPTILDLLDAGSLDHVQGQSLRPLLEAQTDDLELAAYAESLEANAQFGLSILRSLHADHWKYILAPRPQLYDLDTDKQERDNVIDAHPRVANRLRARLRQVIVEAPEPPPPGASTVQLAREDLARLAALGYVGTDSNPQPATPEIDRFEPRGGDPKDFTDVFTLYSQSHWALTAGRLNIGERLLRRLVERMPQSPRLRADLGFILQQQGKTDQALAQYEQAAQQAPGDGHIQRMYGGLLIRLKRWPEAARRLASAVADRPDDQEAWYNLGLAVAMQGHFDEAETHFKRALRIDPQNVSIIHALGAVYLQQNRLRDAEHCFEQALAINPNHRRAQHDLMVVRRRLKQTAPDGP